MIYFILKELNMIFRKLWSFGGTKVDIFVMAETWIEEEIRTSRSKSTYSFVKACLSSWGQSRRMGGHFLKYHAA